MNTSKNAHEIFCECKKTKHKHYQDECQYMPPLEPSYYMSCCQCQESKVFEDLQDAYDNGWMLVDYDFDYCGECSDKGTLHQEALDSEYEVSLCLFQIVSKICASQ